MVGVGVGVALGVGVGLPAPVVAVVWGTEASWVVLEVVWTAVGLRLLAVRNHVRVPATSTTTTPVRTHRTALDWWCSSGSMSCWPLRRSTCGPMVPVPAPGTAPAPGLIGTAGPTGTTEEVGRV